MANINWDEPFYFGDIPIPTYGNFGGPGFTNGVFVGSGDTPDPIPVDALDALFAAHDAATATDLTPQPVDDIALVQAIVALKPNQLDEEASVYAGVTTLVLLGQLIASDNLDFVPQKQIAKATKDAVHNIERGIKQWSEDEIADAQDWLADVAQVTGLPEVADVLDFIGLDLPRFHGHHAEWLV